MKWRSRQRRTCWAKKTPGAPSSNTMRLSSASFFSSYCYQHCTSLTHSFTAFICWLWRGALLTCHLNKKIKPKIGLQTMHKWLTKKKRNEIFTSIDWRSMLQDPPILRPIKALSQSITHPINENKANGLLERLCRQFVKWVQWTHLFIAHHQQSFIQPFELYLSISNPSLVLSLMAQKKESLHSVTLSISNNTNQDQIQSYTMLAMPS